MFFMSRRKGQKKARFYPNEVKMSVFFFPDFLRDIFLS